MLPCTLHHQTPDSALVSISEHHHLLRQPWVEVGREIHQVELIRSAAGRHLQRWCCVVLGEGIHLQKNTELVILGKHEISNIMC